MECGGMSSRASTLIDVGISRLPSNMSQYCRKRYRYNMRSADYYAPLRETLHHQTDAKTSILLL